MRIISGSHKGRAIKPPPGLKVRPTTDIARESLFNILNNITDYDNLKVLDLFAGTGSVSYEFASRGAAQVDAVEANPKHAGFIANTASKLGLKSLHVYREDIRRYLGRTSFVYDLVFADPPYNLEGLDDIPGMVIDSGCLKPGGLLILEHPGKYSFSNHKYFSDHRKYGSVNFTFFRIPLRRTND